jgi:hypothetical protein
MRMTSLTGAGASITQSLTLVPEINGLGLAVDLQDCFKTTWILVHSAAVDEPRVSTDSLNQVRTVTEGHQLVRNNW